MEYQKNRDSSQLNMGQILNRTLNNTPEIIQSSFRNEIEKPQQFSQRSFTKSCRDEEIYLKYNYLFEDDEDTLKQIYKNAEYMNTIKNEIDHQIYLRRINTNENQKPIQTQSKFQRQINLSHSSVTPNNQKIKNSQQYFKQSLLKLKLN